MAQGDVGDPVVKPLGNFAAGERPDAVSYEFLDWEGNPIDLSAQTAIDFDFSKDGATAVHGTGSTQVTAGEAGVQSVVEYAWDAADAGMTRGHFVGRFWVTLPSNEYASHRIIWYVDDAIKGP